MVRFDNFMHKIKFTNMRVDFRILTKKYMMRVDVELNIHSTEKKNKTVTTKN